MKRCVSGAYFRWNEINVTNMTRIQISKLGFIIAAFASFLFSVGLWFSGSKAEGAFVGLWVPSILSVGTLILGRQTRE